MAAAHCQIRRENSVLPPTPARLSGAFFFSPKRASSKKDMYVVISAGNFVERDFLGAQLFKGAREFCKNGGDANKNSRKEIEQTLT